MKADYEKAAEKLIGSFVNVLVAMRQNMVEDERRFFAIFDKPWEATSLSRSYDAAIQQFQSLHINAETIHAFGVDVYANAPEEPRLLSAGLPKLLNECFPNAAK